MNERFTKIIMSCALAMLLICVPAFGAEVNGTITIPASSTGWNPNIYGMKVRIEGTGLEATVMATSKTTGEFTLMGVPYGLVTVLIIEADYSSTVPYDVFTQASKRLQVNVTSDTIFGVEFSLKYHWQELAGYPLPWGNTGYGEWAPHFVSDQVGFLLFRVRGTGIDPERSELYRTLDGGKTWEEIGYWEYSDLVEPYPVYWRSFYFSDQNHGIILAAVSCIPCGWCGAGFLYTDDGGENWSYAPLPLPSDAYSINIQRYAQINENQIIAAGTIGCGVQGYSLKYYSAIWESVDAGAVWELKWISQPNDQGPFTGLGANFAGKAIAFITGYSGGPRRYVLRDNSGNWLSTDDSSIVTNSGNGPADIPMVGDRAWVSNSTNATLPYGLYRSENAGSKWSKVADVLMQYMDFATEEKGFALAGGPAYVTYDGGATWYYQGVGGGSCCHLNNIWAFNSTSAVWQDSGVGDPDTTAALFSYNEPWDANFEILPGIALEDDDIYANDKKVPVGSFKLFNHGPVPLVLDRIIVRASGSGNESVDVKSLQLWWDKNADGIADTGDTLFASGSYNTDDSDEQLAGAGLVLDQFMPIHILVTYDFNEYLFRGKNYAFSLEAKGVFAKTQDTQEELNPTAPNNYPLYSRKLTVAPDDFSAVEFFITRFYQLCLSRSPDQSGLDGWVNALVDGTQTGSDVAFGFVFSNEFLNKIMTNEEYLQILYKAFFNRQPDTAGLQGWLDAMQNGTTREDVLNGFIYATEFANLCDEYGIKAFEGHITKAQREAVEAFVTRFYQLCLDRDPDAAGLEGWTNNLLNQIQTGADVANGFIYSQEFIDKDTANDEYLTILYKAFFNRDPDQGGWDVWIAELNSGKDRGEVLNGFLGSQEFIKLCLDFGIAPL